MTDSAELFSLAELFGLTRHEAVAIIGSGGKTTLLWYLAVHFRPEKVLVTPTTKIFLPPPQKDPIQIATDTTTVPTVHSNISGNHGRDGHLPSRQVPNKNPDQNLRKNLGTNLGTNLGARLYYDHFYDAETFARLTSALPGITLSGQFLAGDFSAGKNAMSQPSLQKTSKPRRNVPNPERFAHKITALPPEVLASQKKLFDKVFMECDGSRNLPLKGWAPHEPVIPDFTTMTVAVIPLWSIGLTAGDDCIHRGGLFYAMAQCRAGDTIGPKHLARVIAHPQGLLAKAKGKKVLLLHLQNPTQVSLARELLSLLPVETVYACNRIVTGSAREGWGTILHQEFPTS